MLSMENGGGLWQPCDTPSSAEQVRIFETVNNQGNFPSCGPPSSFLPSWPTDDYVPDISLMTPFLVDPSFSHVISPSVSSEFQDLIGTNPKFAHHGHWGPYDNFNREPDMQDILPGLAGHQYVHMGRSPAVSDQPEHKYNMLQGVSVLSPTPVPSSQGMEMTVAQAAQYESPSSITNPLEIFLPALPRGSYNNSRLGGDEAMQMALPFANQHHGIPPVSSVCQGVSPPDMGPANPLPSGASGPAMFNFEQKSSSMGLLPTLSGPSIPTHKLDVGADCVNMARSSFNPGPYVGCVPPDQQQASDASCGSSGICVGSTKTGSSAKIGFELRPQAELTESRPSRASPVAMWAPPLQMPRIVAPNGQSSLPEEKVPGSVQQPRTGTQMLNVANVSPGNVLKRQSGWGEANHPQGKLPMKKAVQKWPGGEPCSRLEVISQAAHRKVSQSTSSSGRALGPALNTNLKPRARQGSANDPQSIAARVRRERISDRLKVLQALIPNGDKVDMVTMLEKAINYVQALELQIRMLKNDSLWPKALGNRSLQELIELTGHEFADMDKLEVADEKAKTNKTLPIEEEQGANSAQETE